MPPRICASIVSGLTTMPGSTAQTIRSTLSAPSSRTVTSATCATSEPKDSCSTMPRPRRPPAPARAGAPAGLRRDQVEQRQLPRVLREQLAPELVGVLPGAWATSSSMLEHEGVDAVPDRTPEADRHVRVLEHVVDPEVRDAVDLVRRAFERDRIEPVLDELREHPAHDRGRHAAVLPGDDPTAVVDPDLDPVQASRTVEVVLHVLFARPDQLHRPADRLGHRCRLEREVELEPPAEAAAEERGVMTIASGGSW